MSRSANALSDQLSKPAMAKAQLEPVKVQDASELPSELPELTLHAMRRAYGKVLVAAEQLKMHEASLGRLVKEGDLKLKQLAALGPKTLVELGKGLIETYGPMADTPEHAADKSLNRIQDEINELRQYVESKRTA